MDSSIFSRGISLYGEKAYESFQKSRVAVVGLGGVGSWVVEALARTGIGHLRLVDFDRIQKSNLNRQIHALHSTLGLKKTEVARERALDINPDCKVEVLPDFCAIESRDRILTGVDIIVDAIDGLGPKTGLIEAAWRAGIPLISVMGAGGKRDPSMIRIADLFESRVCPLASRVRRYLRRRGIEKGVPVVYSEEKPIPSLPPDDQPEEETTLQRGRKRGSVASGMVVTAVMGCFAAGWVLEYLSGIENSARADV